MRIVENAELERLAVIVARLNKDEELWQSERKSTQESFARSKGLHGRHTRPVPSSEWFRENSVRISDELQVYVNTWLDADRHFGVWQNRNPELDATIQRVQIETRFLLSACHDGRADNRVRCYFPDQKKQPLEQSTIHAARAFAELARSALRERVGKCDRCGRYYLSGGSYLKKRFCSRNCSKNDSALTATRKRREHQRERKVAAARKALQSLPMNKKRSAGWKAVVAAAAGVTQKWLTRAMNAGDLKTTGRGGAK